MDDLEHLNQGKLCLHISMQGFKEKFGEASRKEKKRQMWSGLMASYSKLDKST